jgi:hypothetical protein
MLFEKLADRLVEVGRDLLNNQHYPSCELTAQDKRHISMRLANCASELLSSAKGGSTVDLITEFNGRRQFNGVNIYDRLFESVWIQPIGGLEQMDNHIDATSGYVSDLLATYQWHRDWLENAIFEEINTTPAFPETEFSRVFNKSQYQLTVLKLIELGRVDATNPARLVWREKYTHDIRPFIGVCSEVGALNVPIDEAFGRAFKASFATLLKEATIFRIDKKLNSKKTEFYRKNFDFLNSR